MGRARKTNAEIAELLWLAPSTVRKHLENVYAKLGVSTRTAAVARFLGLIDRPSLLAGQQLPQLQRRVEVAHGHVLVVRASDQLLHAAAGQRVASRRPDER